jgi:hypothetical protein
VIIGGVNAAGKAGGLRCGYSEGYLPCTVRVVNRRIIDAIERSTKTANTWRASARIRGVAGSAWVDLGSASYFQVTRNNEGSLDSADLTLQQPEVWSPYLAQYPDLLRPSNRLVQIKAGMVIGGTWYPVIVFSGHVKDYSEALGASGGGISLRLEDSRDIASRTAPAVTAITKASAFRHMLAQQATFASAGVIGTVVRVSFNDRVLEAYVPNTTTSGDVMTLLTSQISGFPLLQITGSGSLKIGQEQTSETIERSFAYSDKNIHVANRRFSGDAQVNVVRVFGLVGTVGTAGEVSDAADVAKRGRVVYGAGYIGSTTMLYTDAEALGLEHIGGSLRGLIDMEIPFNPYLQVGMAISLTSSRLGISTAMTGKVYELSHQYSTGRCRTYLRKMRVF